jgi:ubiquinone/menaquinone biosynthesis C-methylase UbiE
MGRNFNLRRNWFICVEASLDEDRPIVKQVAIQPTSTPAINHQALFIYPVLPFPTTAEENRSERVLDFGCGGGIGSVCLAKLLNNSGELTCVDASSYWIDRAKHRLRRYRNAKCLVGDIRKLDMPERHFNIISIIHVIHDIAPADRQSITDTLARLLNREGKLFIREPIKESHGMPVSEIVSLLTNSGLSEAQANVSKSEYRGVFAYRD